MTTPNATTEVLALIAIGICDALVENKIDIDDAEQLLFSPYAMGKVAKCDPRILELIHMGTELGNVKDLIPHEYDPTINRIKEIALECLGTAASLCRSDDHKHWIDSLL